MDTVKETEFGQYRVTDITTEVDGKPYNAQIVEVFVIETVMRNGRGKRWHYRLLTGKAKARVLREFNEKKGA